MILFGAFIKYFIFGEAPPADTTRSPLSAGGSHNRSVSFTYSGASPARKLRSDGIPHGAPSPSSGGGVGGAAHIPPPPAAPVPPAHILAKTYYDVHAHPPESLDWFNVLVAQTLAQLRADAATSAREARAARDAGIGEQRIQPAVRRNDMPDGGVD